MDKSKVKEILIGAKNNVSSEKRYKHRSVGRAYLHLKRRAKKDGKGEVFDNFYLVEEAFSAVKGVRITRKLEYFSSLLLPLMSNESISDDLAAFFEVLGDELDSEECESVREAFFAQCIIALADNSLSSPELIRKLQAFDFSPFMLGFVKYEHLLRRDGIYPLLDRDTKALYKEKIKLYSRRRGLSFTEGCERLIREASEKKCHIGQLLPLQNGKRAWLLLPVVIFALLSLWMLYLLKGTAQIPFLSFVFALAIVPLWQTSFDLFAPVMSRFCKCDILPRIDVPKITKERATLTVIASLGTNVSDVEKVFSHLELLSLKTVSRGKDDGAYWGVLLDLPESKNAVDSKDARIIKCAQKEADRLNQLYNSRFLLFTRDRVWNEKEQIFTSHERKRGALVQLVRLLDGKESTLKVYGASLPEIKYVLTLDSDTDMELGAVNRMVGTMEHPMNRPVVEKRRGTNVVVKGFGMLQPALINSLESVHKTRFSTIMSGAGGVDAYHSSIFNLNSALFGKGIFCGKGMFDVKAFSQVLTDAFPDGIVLSHDILEGTRLRTGYLSDVCFFDSVPSNAISFYKRAHRWARGDVQSLEFTKRRIKTPNSTVANPMLSEEKFVFFMNVVGLLTPVFQVLGLLALMRYGTQRLTLVSFFFLLPCLTPLFNEILRAASGLSLSNIMRRFFGDTLTGLCRESLMLWYRISSLAFLAYNNTDAIVRALWRMKVSGKKLLEWTTAGQNERGKNRLASYFLFTLPSFIIGVFMLTFSRHSLCKLAGILWCLFFLTVYSLGHSAKEKPLSLHRKKVLSRYAADIWRYFDTYADSTNNYLPPDNVSVFPSSEVACRTSPTNIGLYLLSILAALDFSLISLESASARLDRALEAVERLPKYRGQLYNWYSTLTLEVIGQEYISTVDSGNFITCLVALYQGLEPLEKGNKKIKSIRERIKKLEEETDFRFLFNPSRNLFSLGFFVDSEKQDPIVYDMYMSEARTTDYYAVARGIVRESHWASLSRPLITTLFGIGALSWSGTSFEYFMPHLLLPLYRNSFSHEALSFAFAEQMKYSSVVNGERVFGISESGYFAFDESLGYQYRAFGIPSLSRRVETECQKVISPYSSFLMLRAGTGAAMKNLENLEKAGMYGEFGFYEAVDTVASRVGERPSVVKSFMSHHLGMSLIACANGVYDDIFVKRFMSDKQMMAVSELLKEAVPADARVIKKEKLQKAPERRKHLPAVKQEIGLRTQASTWALTGREASAVTFERGLLSLDVSRKGERISAVRPLDSTRECALFVFSNVEGRVSSPSVSPDVSYSFDTGFAEYRQGDLRATLSLSSHSCAARIRLEASGEKGCVGMYFEPLLTPLESFMSHPAFSNIFFKAEYTDSALILSRLGEKPYFLAVVANSPFDFEVSRETLLEGEEFSLEQLVRTTENSLTSPVESVPISPCVFLKSKFTGRTDTTFVIGFGRSRSEALTNATEELDIPYSRSIRQSRELFYSALTASGGELDRQIFEDMLRVFRPEEKHFCSSMPEGYSKNGVYSLGISGNFPIYLVREGVSQSELEKLIVCHKLHYVMGIRYELVIEVTDSGYSRGGRAEIQALTEHLQCAFLLGRSGGIHLADVRTLPRNMLTALASASYPSDRRVKKYPYLRTVTQVEECQVADGDIVIQSKPPVLRSHVIASSTFGTILSHRSLGNTWIYNSRLSRITYWENDSVGGRYSEKLILEKNGVEKDLCASASATRFSCGSAEYISRRFNIKVAVHPTLMFKAVSVSVEDDSFSLLYKFLPVLDDFPRPSGKIQYFVRDNNAVVFRNVFSDSMTKGFGYLMLPFEKEMKISDGFGVACDRGGEVVFVLGYAGSEKHYEAVRRYFEGHRFSDVYALSQKSIGDLLKGESCFWLSYQTLVSRFMARSGPYQSGGAWGFRDQAQDCLTLLDIAPLTVRNHIMRMASHQYREGDVQHWWHRARGVRTNCSDDYLWLVWLTAVYILRTKDKSVLCVEIPYLDSKPLSATERDRYEYPQKTKEAFPVSHHLKNALELLVKRGLGDRSLPLMLGGDWNDGMNMLPEGSESVWLAFFARIVIHLYKEVTGDDSYSDFSQQIRHGIEENAFFSDRYARAFLPDGSALGVEGSHYFEIDALPQAFASICHSITKDGDETRITLALDSAWKELYDSKKRVFRLFTPPLASFDKSIGYLSAYPEGLRENGGQYTHAAAWMGLALLCAPDKKDENRRRAQVLRDAIEPSSHPADEYKAEQYVLCGDVYSNGRGGWSWYTGSAAWYRDLILRLSDENRNKRAPLT